ncbi:hypothetical protein [Stutzerimonas kirkiae]|uniref:hypothetical protein n=1 Tax=Stutzerimonas kirkiae TaxID=2211392 RepID=UPI00103839FE|nr:hypothetical protein [Stutzerimonas kirkiae]TBV10232.1 hypothetical protein DNK08_07075 [Stutzerimonas kirkiae]
MSPETIAMCMAVQKALESFAHYCEWNAPSQIAFARYCRELGKPLSELTVADLQAIAQRTEEYAQDYFALRSRP